MPPPPLCRHCASRYAYQGRGLCGPCYRDTAVRDLYPPARPAKRQPPPEGREAEKKPPPPPPPPVVCPQQLDAARRPCRALPGTTEKLEAMAARAALRLSLFLEGDGERRL